MRRQSRSLAGQKRGGGPWAASLECCGTLKLARELCVYHVPLGGQAPVPYFLLPDGASSQVRVTTPVDARLMKNMFFVVLFSDETSYSSAFGAASVGTAGVFVDLSASVGSISSRRLSLTSV